VKILENMLESGHPPDVREINIVHSIVMNENRELYRNHYPAAVLIMIHAEVLLAMPEAMSIVRWLNMVERWSGSRGDGVHVPEGG